MKWIQYAVIAGSLCLSNGLPVVSWGQTRQRPTPIDGVASVEGTIVDAQTRRPVTSATVIAKNEVGAVRAQQIVNADGKYQIKLDPTLAYIFTVQANGYDLHEEHLAFTSPKVNYLGKPPIFLIRTGAKPGTQSVPRVIASAAAPPVTAAQPPVTQPNPNASSTATPTSERVTPPKTLDAKVIYTPPLVVAAPGKVTQLRAIQFVQSKAELLPDAQPALEQLLEFMQSKPTVDIELAGHTDNQGDFDQNLRLSKERVDVVKAYLVKSGIEANRITTRGYGPTRPIASNNSEATRQLNRRVEMIVLKQ